MLQRSRDFSKMKLETLRGKMARRSSDSFEVNILGVDSHSFQPSFFFKSQLFPLEL